MKKALLILMLLLLPLVYAANINLDDLDVIKFTLEEGEDKTIQFNDVEYSIKADSVLENEIRLDFQPTNLALAIKKEQTISDIDIDNDKEVDFSIKYLSNIDKIATLQISKTTTKETEEAEAGEESDETKEDQLPDTEAISSALRKNMKIIIGGVILLVILILVFSRKKNNPDKLYNKAEGLHREAKEFHEDGDEETASELYDKAEELREKARELEKTGGI